MADQLDESFYNCAINGMKIKYTYDMIKSVCPIYKPKIVIISSGHIDFRKEDSALKVPSVMKMKSYMRFPYLFYGSIPPLIKKNSLNTYEVFQTEIKEKHGTAEGGIVFSVGIITRKESGLSIIKRKHPVIRWICYYAVVAVIMYSSPEEESQFIYFQF
ncbi:MAG: hypothetical protein MJZ50_09650 [Treponema sp.]|nr:hypothetical protein [Treponema sp.]